MVIFTHSFIAAVVTMGDFTFWLSPWLSLLVEPELFSIHCPSAKLIDKCRIRQQHVDFLTMFPQQVELYEQSINQSINQFIDVMKQYTNKL